LPATVHPHPLGSAAVSQVDEAVSWLRVGRPAPLNIERTAALLRIELAERDLGATLMGLTLDARRVFIHGALPRPRKLFVFAHEIAHVLRRRGWFATIPARDEEWLADWFARELLLPRRWLDAGSVRRQDAADVELETLALQLAVVGQAPSIMRLGDRILCRHCGTAPRLWGCPCREARRDSCSTPNITPWQLLNRNRLVMSGPRQQLRLPV
jgi:IrrE N-terminal-like domain